MRRWPCALLLVALVGVERSPSAETGSRPVAPWPADLQIRGAGATFPSLLYRRWIAVHAAVEPTVNIIYDSVGSSEGLRRIVADQVQFAATESGLPDERPGPQGRILEEIPVTLGAVVLAYNLPESQAALKLTPEVIADIFLGKIRRWDDERLRALNPGTYLPARPIVVVHRSDGSGTTDIFTRYLAASDDWRATVGAGASVPFPVGEAAQGNEGVSGTIRTFPGTIGYVQLTFARQLHLQIALLRNRAGRFVPPTLESITAAARSVPIAASGEAAPSLVDAPGEGSYPLAGYSKVLVHRSQVDRERGAALAEFLWWCVHEGQAEAVGLHHPPLPPDAVALAERLLRRLNVAGVPLLSR